MIRRTAGIAALMLTVLLSAAAEGIDFQTENLYLLHEQLPEGALQAEAEQPPVQPPLQLQEEAEPFGVKLSQEAPPAVQTEERLSLADMAQAEAATALSATEPPRSTAAPEEKAAWPRTLRVTFGGDTTLGSTDELRKRDDCFENVVAALGYDWCFSGLLPVFSEDDLTLVNFEGTLTDETSKKEKKFNFKGPSEYTQILTRGSVEAVTVANNHTLDYGKQGREDTVAALQKAGLIVSGNGMLGIFEKNGIKVGMTGYCFPYTNGKKDISQDVKNLRKAGCQVVIASFHWGSEYRADFTGEQRSIGRAALKAGADIVVGHHPHIVQGVEAYGDSYILYSLGNLVFGGNVDPEDRDSVLARATFTVYEDHAEPPVLELIPIRLTQLERGTDYRPVLAGPEDSSRILERILKRSSGMENFVNGSR